MLMSLCQTVDLHIAACRINYALIGVQTVDVVSLVLL